MKMKVLLILLLLNISSIYGQKVKDLSKVQVVLDYHYNLGLNERGDLFNASRSDLSMYGSSLRLYVLYNLNKQIALGAGTGLDRYENTGHNTLPIFISCHYSPLIKIPRAYTFSNLGYGIGGSDFTKGFLFDIGIGYKRMFRKHFGLNFQLGYNMKQFKGEGLAMDESEKIINKDFSQIRHSLSFGFGFIF